MQRISTRLEALDRLGKFESRAEKAKHQKQDEAMGRVWAVFHEAYPTTELRRTLAPDGKSWQVTEEPGAKYFDSQFDAFCRRVYSDTATAADRDLIAQIPDAAFENMSFGKVEYIRALARIFTEFT